MKMYLLRVWHAITDGHDYQLVSTLDHDELMSCSCGQRSWHSTMTLSDYIRENDLGSPMIDNMRRRSEILSQLRFRKKE